MRNRSQRIEGTISECKDFCIARSGKRVRAMCCVYRREEDVRSQLEVLWLKARRGNEKPAIDKRE